ncbi:isoprenylcysteine carboxylmethyltransferase family protein [Streptacidiphilus sp. EB103A]|uniref:methyltransferase family protein n=1 Tax=Streptacidiphilus sp. EB103A TaxID=3156275 RepID=UPI003513093C
MSVPEQEQENTGGGARVFPVPPPLYFAGGFAAGMALHHRVPLPLGGRPVTGVLGAVAVAGGVVLAAGGAREILRRRTTIVPHHAVSTLVTTGVYQVSRNPMYTGLALVHGGGALLAGSWWPLIDLPLVLFAVRRLVIEPEEEYLASRFEEYAEYRRRVRRWL